MRRLSYSLGSLLSIEEVLECSKKLNEIKPEVMWIPETWGMENFSMLGLSSKENTFSKNRPTLDKEGNLEKVKEWDGKYR